MAVLSVRGFHEPLHALTRIVFRLGFAPNGLGIHLA